MDRIHTQLEEALGEGRVKAGFILAPYTTFKIGGPAEYFFIAESEAELIASAATSFSLGLQLTILGGASNVLLPDAGVPGLVVMNKYSEFKILSRDFDAAVIEVSSGYPMGRLVRETITAGLEGFEYHLGLPGTVGGAIYMNSKWAAHPPTKYVGDALVSAKLMTRRGNVKTVDKAYFQFAYDYSILQKTHEILLSAQFRLNYANKITLKSRSQQALEYRKKTQPLGAITAGCMFRNVEGKSVGKMIDGLGLMGYKIGGAIVSDIHANFIVSDGTATADDVKRLASFIKQKVKKAYNIDLQEEILLL